MNFEQQAITDAKKRAAKYKGTFWQVFEEELTETIEKLSSHPGSAWETIQNAQNYLCTCIEPLEMSAISVVDLVILKNLDPSLKLLHVEPLDNNRSAYVWQIELEQAPQKSAVVFTDNWRQKYLGYR